MTRTPSPRIPSFLLAAPALALLLAGCAAGIAKVDPAPSSRASLTIHPASTLEVIFTLEQATAATLEIAGLGSHLEPSSLGGLDLAFSPTSN